MYKFSLFIVILSTAMSCAPRKNAQLSASRPNSNSEESSLASPSPSASPRIITPIFSPKCEALSKDRVCTEEYAPTTCVFETETAKRENRCFATLEVEQMACEKNLKFKAEAVRCQEATPSEVTDWRSGATSEQINCRSTTICPQHIDPHTCTFKDIKLDGSNRCHAMAKVREGACKTGWLPQDKEIKCTKKK